MDESMQDFSLTEHFFSSTPTSASVSRNIKYECSRSESLNICARPSKMTITDGQFFRKVPEKCLFDTIVATCVKCEPTRIEIKGTGASSSNFLCHLRRRHGVEAVQEYRRYMCSKSRDVPKARGRSLNKETTPFQKNLEDNVLKFVLHSMVPLKAVSNPFFWRIFENMNIPRRDLGIINSQSWESKIEQLYGVTSEQIKAKLNEMSHVFCMVNVWSSGNSSFLVTTAHGIEKGLKRKSILLRFQRLINKTSPDKIAKMIQKTQEEFELWTAKTTTIVGEHSFVFRQAFESFGIESSSIDGTEEKVKSSYDDTDSDADLKTSNIYIDKAVLHSLSLDPFRCAVQTLTLCASVDLVKALLDCRCLSQIHENVMKKCNLIWNHIEAVRAVIGFSLTRPCANNWSSIYSSLREILTLQNKSIEVFQALDNKDFLVESEFLYIEEHLTCTKPIADALAILQDNDHTLYGYLLPTLLVLRRKMNQLLAREWVYCHPLAVENVRMVNEKFEDFFNFTTPESIDASVASFSHPGFKNNWLSCVETKYQTKVTHAFKEAIAAELPPVQPANVDKLAQAYEHEFFDFGTENEVVEPVSLVTVAEMQALNYFNHSNRNLAVVDNFPEIKKVFLEYNTPLSSFAPAESIFSYKALKEVLELGQPIDKYTEMRIFLKANMDTINTLKC